MASDVFRCRRRSAHGRSERDLARIHSLRHLLGPVSDRAHLRGFLRRGTVGDRPEQQVNGHGRRPARATFPNLMATSQASKQSAPRPRTSQPKKSFSVGRFLLGAVALLVWVAALAAVGGVIAYEYQHTGHIFQGVQVRGIDLGNLTVSEAEERLRVAFDPYPLAPITIRYGDQTWVLTAGDLGVRLRRSQCGRSRVSGRPAAHRRQGYPRSAHPTADQSAATTRSLSPGSRGAGSRGDRPLGRPGVAGSESTGNQPASLRGDAARRRAGRRARHPARLATRWT